MRGERLPAREKEAFRRFPLISQHETQEEKNRRNTKKHYLNMPAQLRGELFFLYVFHSCFASEQVNRHTGRKQALVLLPFQGL